MLWFPPLALCWAWLQGLPPAGVLVGGFDTTWHVQDPVPGEATRRAGCATAGGAYLPELQVGVSGHALLSRWLGFCLRFLGGWQCGEMGGGRAACAAKQGGRYRMGARAQPHAVDVNAC